MHQSAAVSSPLATHLFFALSWLLSRARDSPLPVPPCACLSDPDRLPSDELPSPAPATATESGGRDPFTWRLRALSPWADPLELDEEPRRAGSTVLRRARALWALPAVDSGSAALASFPEAPGVPWEDPVEARLRLLTRLLCLLPEEEEEPECEEDPPTGV